LMHRVNAECTSESPINVQVLFFLLTFPPLLSVILHAIK
jgi:hypothetical protein